ncbi:MAG: DHH family phosphoesterase [Cytophagaceae bacterium]|jgi:phosphoesterase RecJ-like protein|nr:DHH family phosphoesterase [Cytophagaceae bacterium]
MQQQLDVLKAALQSPKKIVITTHHKPDADALGSSLAMYRYLSKKGHTVQVITPSDYPEFLNWMQGNDTVLIYNETTATAAAEWVQTAEMIFCLDFNALSRINELGEWIRQSKATKVLIDHHLQPEAFADIMISDTSSAATCSLIYECIIGMGDRSYMDTYIGECIYAGIMTDTGSFRHPSTDRKVHQIVADLYSWNVDTPKVHRLIYDTNTEERLRLLGYALTEKLVILDEYYTAYIPLSKEDLSRFESKTGDTEGLVNYALSLEKVVFAAMIVEREDGVKISFRSKADFSVNEFARKHFQGGGHKNASGGKSLLSLEDTIKQFRDLIPQYKDELLDNLRKEKFLC